MTVNEIISQCEEIISTLEHKSEELKLNELLKDIDAKRADWQRKSSLFIPSKQRLERGRQALELGEAYESIKELRIHLDKAKIKQASLRDDMSQARTLLHNAEEALNLIESEFRDKLNEQTKLDNLVQRVKAMDSQLLNRQEAASQTRTEFDEAEQKLKECTSRLESQQKELVRIEVALREARKFLQTHTTDEKLITGLSGIQRCFVMYSQAEEKRKSIRESWGNSITKKQNAQSSLNDRAALLSDITHRYSVLKKNYSRARSFFESTLKGKTITEWREICEKNINRLSELDELYRKYQELKELEGKLKHLQESRMRIQQETRSLNIKDVEQSGKIHELQEEVMRLEKRVKLLHRIEDIDAVRELLQDSAPCPLCGSTNHPYTSGISVPDPEEIHNQLREAQNLLNDLHEQLTARQTKTGRLNDEIESIGKNESELKSKVNELNAEISSRVSLLGLNLSSGIPPFEILDRERQKTRDSLQLARNAADTSEAAERDMKAAKDELDKIIEMRAEAAKIHQEALFLLQSEKSNEEQFTVEGKTQDEIVNSLKQELLSKIMPYGYKAIPDKNPEQLIEALEHRLEAWQEGSRKCDELEHEFTSANAVMSTIKKEREALRVRRDELASRVKAVEAERDSVKQQRIILFEAKNPDKERERMNESVESLRTQLNERQETKNKCAAELDIILTSIHALETEMAKAREELQKNEIAFNKRLLALGFKNEDDYAAALLTTDERRDLQAKLRELNETDFALTTERENTRAKILEFQAKSDNFNFDRELLTQKIKTLKQNIDELRTHSINNPDEAAVRQRISDEFIPKMKDLMLTCGLEEVF